MKKFISTCLLVIWMGVIFFLSSQNGDTSGNLSNGLLYEIAIFLRVSDVEGFILKYGLFIRKFAHFTEYFILGFIMYLCFRQYTKKSIFLVCLILCFLYACSDEIHQLFIDERCFAVLDIMIDTSGSVSALGFLHLIEKKCFQEKKQ